VYTNIERQAYKEKLVRFTET